MPWPRYWLIRSISTIALVTTMPTSMSMPMSAGTPSAVPVTSRSAIAPVAANGIDTSRMSGWIRLRKVAAITRNTIAIAASSARPEVAERVGLVGADAAEAVRRAGRQRERRQPLGELGRGGADVRAGRGAADGDAAVAVDTAHLHRTVHLGHIRRPG